MKVPFFTYLKHLMVDTRTIKLTGAFIFSCLFFSTTHASANLLIKPFRAVLDDKNRTAEITLLNSSKETRTYNIGWEEKTQTTSGGYTDTANYDFSASDYIRHSPRKVTIAPGEYQKIKLRLNLPKDIPAGEYRSHLAMKAIANLPQQKDDVTEGMKVQIIPQLSFTIPIMVRKGKSNATADIDAIRVIQDGKDEKISVMLNHNGDFSTYGSLYAYLKKDGEKAQQIGEAHNIALFRETKQRKADIIVQIPKIPKGSVIQVVYQGEEEFEGQVLGKAAIRY